MRVLVKGYYGYKNLGDELILFSLLSWIEETLKPHQISIIAGNPERLENRLITHKEFFPPIINKITILPNPDWKGHLKTFLGMERKKYDFIVFGGGQVIDEERKFPHNGRNLPLLYGRSIRKWRYALVGGIGTQNKEGTAFLQKMLLKNAKAVILRDSFSEGLSENLLEKADWSKVQTFGDLSLPLLEESKALLDKGKIKNTRDPYVLVNISPLCKFEQAVKKVKLFLRKFPKAQPIYFPASLSEDSQFFSRLQEHIPSLELFDWTKAGVANTMKLLYFAEGGIGARLHFLYPLKFFGNRYEVLHNSHKNQINLADID